MRDEFVSLVCCGLLLVAISTADGLPEAILAVVGVGIYLAYCAVCWRSMPDTAKSETGRRR